jgi:hypothetical protein
MGVRSTITNVIVDPVTGDFQTGTTPNGDPVFEEQTVAFRVRAQVSESAGEMIASVELERSDSENGPYEWVDSMLVIDSTGTTHTYEAYDWAPPDLSAPNAQLFYQAKMWYTAYKVTTRAEEAHP